MKRLLLAVVLTAACLTAVLADEPVKDNDEASARAKAAIAITKAKSLQPRIVALTKPLPYAEAVKVARAEKKPLVVTVGLNCSGLCKELRPDFVTCHEPVFDGSSAPRMMLLLHDGGGTLFKVAVWDKLPSPDEVRAAAVKGRARLDPQTAVRQELLEAAIVDMFALEFGPSPYSAACPNGNCPNCPQSSQPIMSAAPAGQVFYNGTYYNQMPLAPEQRMVIRYAPAEGHRRRLFGAFRHRVRSAMGLDSCQGSSMMFAPAVAAQAPAAPAMPEVVGATLGGHRLIKAYLAKRGVPAADLDKLEAKYGEGSGIWSQLLKLLLEEGLPIVIEWLKTLVA